MRARVLLDVGRLGGRSARHWTSRANPITSRILDWPAKGVRSQLPVKMRNSPCAYLVHLNMGIIGAKVLCLRDNGYPYSCDGAIDSSSTAVEYFRYVNQLFF